MEHHPQGKRPGRRPNALDPTASAAAALGAALREARFAKGHTLETLSAETGYSIQHISSIELGITYCSAACIGTMDAALDTDGKLGVLLDATVQERLAVRGERANAQHAARLARKQSNGRVTAVKRRAFLSLGLIAVLCPEAGARALKAAEVDWIVYEWSREIHTATDARTLLTALSADLKTLRHHPRAVAQLGSFAASIAVTKGDYVLARRWWRQARQAAAEANDPHLQAFVAARQAVHGQHGIYSPPQLVVLANDALAATKDPCVGRVLALSAKAQALALTGQAKPARHVLQGMESEFERLPSDLRRDRVTALGAPEDRLTFVASFLGAFADMPYPVDGAANYSPVVWRGLAQVRLHRAAAEVDPQHAVAVLSSLKPAQRSDRFVHQTALRVLRRCEAKNAPRTRELHDALVEL